VTPPDFTSDACSPTPPNANRHADVFTHLQRSLAEQMLFAEVRLDYLEQQLKRLLRYALS
jgi:hypothetical protein